METKLIKIRPDCPDFDREEEDGLRRAGDVIRRGGQGQALGQSLDYTYLPAGGSVWDRKPGA